MQSFPFSENGMRVTKHQTVTPVEGVDGLEVVETFFVNEGKPVTVQAYELCRTEMTPQDTVVWSLQPSSTMYRLDWVLPVKEGFFQRNYLVTELDIGKGIELLPPYLMDSCTA